MLYASGSFSLRCLAAAMAVSVLSACSDSTVAASVVGTYTLRSVAGIALPAPARDATGAVFGTATSGTVTLTSTNTYTSSITFVIGGISTPAPAAGTYAQSGSTLTFTPTGGGAVNTGTFSGGNTISATLNSQLYVFMK